MDNLVQKAAKDLGDIYINIQDSFSLQSPERYIDYLGSLKSSYSFVIKDFTNDLYKDYLMMDYNGNSEIDNSKIRQDFINIFGKLETYIKTEGYECDVDDHSGEVVVSPANDIKCSDTVALETVIESISNNPMISKKLAKMVIDQLNELEVIKHSSEPNDVKWKKVKAITKYLLNDSLEVGIVVVPYLSGVVTKLKE